MADTDRPLAREAGRAGTEKRAWPQCRTNPLGYLEAKSQKTDADKPQTPSLRMRVILPPATHQSLV
ncbi:hypothetical protein PT2222_170027 [Paraburkholderia tropica]